MRCPSCRAELSPDDVSKRVCSGCKAEFEVGPLRIKMLLAGLALGSLAVYTYVTSEDGNLVGVGLLAAIATVLVLRSRR